MAIRGDVEISTSPFSFARNRWPFEFIVEWFEYVFSQKKKKNGWFEYVRFTRGKSHFSKSITCHRSSQASKLAKLDEVAQVFTFAWNRDTNNWSNIHSKLRRNLQYILYIKFCNLHLNLRLIYHIHIYYYKLIN